jgi:CelD/BcsL family acetyltransferase involved in cellulose biosynthesis
MDGCHLERLPVISSIIILPDDWATYLKTLSTKRRRSLRNVRNRLEREHPGQARFHRVTESDEVPEAMNTLVALNRARWHSLGDVSLFDADRFEAFHREMAATALQRGWLRLYHLMVANHVVATTYCFRYRDVFYAYQSGFDLEWAWYSPSRLIIAHAIREAIREGAREFDMLRGTEPHKLTWTNAIREDSHLLVSNNWRGHRHLMVARLIDIAVSGGPKVLPRSVRDRLGHFVVFRPARTIAAADDV